MRSPASVLAFIGAGLLTLSSCASKPQPAPAPQPQTAPAAEQPAMDLGALIGSKDTAGIRQFFGNRQSLDKPDSSGMYPLHRAVEQDAPDIVELLLVLGAKPDPLDSKGRSPLRLALEKQRLSSARILAERGASVFAKDATGMSIAESAILAGGETLKAIFSGRNIGSKAEDGTTALHIAADRLSESAVKELLALGADPFARNDRGRSPLDLALTHPERVEAARIAEVFILRGVNPSLPDFSWFAQAVRAIDFASVRFEQGKTTLHEAVERKQKGFVEFVLSRGANPNARNGAGGAALHEAMRAGWLEGARILLRNKADPNARDGFENTPLHIALPESDRSVGIELLLGAGADPSLKDKNGNTPLHIATMLGYHPSLLQRLLGAGSPVNAANSTGDTPLILTVRSGRSEYIPILLERGADIFLVNGKGESALSIALSLASAPASANSAPGTGAAMPSGAGTETLSALLIPANVNARDNQGNTPLHVAVALKSSPEAIAVIVAEGGELNARNNSGDSPLHLAVRGNLKIQGEALLAAKAEVYAANVKGETPISLGLTAANGPIDWLFNSAVIGARDANGDSLLHHAARRDLFQSFRFLGEKGADVTARNADGKSALAVAVEADLVESVKVLLAMGSSLSSRDAMGDTPLHSAVLWGAQKSLAIILASSKDLEMRNYAGESPLHQAIRKRDAAIVSTLLGKGASVHSRDNRGSTALSLASRIGRFDIVSLILAAGGKPDARDLEGKTSLHGAIENGDPETAKLLVAAGADILALDGTGASPLLRASSRNLSLLEALLQPVSVNKVDQAGKSPLGILVDSGCSPEVAELVLARGADPNIRDRNSSLALHAALRANRLDLVRLLVKSGSELFARDRDGESPVSLAISKGEDALSSLIGKESVALTDSLGNGYLHFAALSGNDKAATWLVAMGADKAARNIAGESPSDVARKRGHSALAEKLR